MRRDNRFYSGALVASRDSGDGERGAQGNAFVERVFSFAPGFLQLRILQNFRVAGAGARHVATLARRDGKDAFVKSWDGDVTSGVVQLRENFRENLQGIVHGAAEIPGMQILTRAGYGDFSTERAAFANLVKSTFDVFFAQAIHG